MALLLQGLVIGLTLAAMVGPITFTILDSSLSRGWRAGVLAGLGMWISDIIYIALCYMGGRSIIHSLQDQSAGSWIGVVAGLILMAIGATLWVKRNEHLGTTQHENASRRNLAGHMGRGFLVNTFSPFTVIFWPSLVLTKALNTDMTVQSAFLFFGGIMLTLISGDILKAVFAEWIRRRLSDKYMRTSRIVFAAVFIGIGIFLIVRALFF